MKQQLVWQVVGRSSSFLKKRNLATIFHPLHQEIKPLLAVWLPSKHVPTCLCHSVLGKSRHATLLSISAVEAKSPRRRSLSFHATEAQWPLRHWPSPDNACMPRRRKGIVAEYSTWRRRTINKKPTKKTAPLSNAFRSQKQPATK